MRKLICLIMICFAGLGGYYMGQQPNSPPIFEWMGRAVDQFKQAGGPEWVDQKVQVGKENVVSLLGSDAQPESTVAEATPPSEPDPAPVRREPLPIPRCW